MGIFGDDIYGDGRKRLDKDTIRKSVDDAVESLAMEAIEQASRNSGTTFSCCPACKIDTYSTGSEGVYSISFRIGKGLNMMPIFVSMSKLSPDFDSERKICEISDSIDLQRALGDIFKRNGRTVMYYDRRYNSDSLGALKSFMRDRACPVISKKLVECLERTFDGSDGGEPDSEEE